MILAGQPDEIIKDSKSAARTIPIGNPNISATQKRFAREQESVSRRVDDRLARCDMTEVLAAGLDRKIGWDGNQEVWL